MTWKLQGSTSSVEMLEQHAARLSAGKQWHEFVIVGEELMTTKPSAKLCAQVAYGYMQAGDVRSAVGALQGPHWARSIPQG